MTARRFPALRVAIVFATLALLDVAPLPSCAATVEAVDFNRDVRRILSENCFRCHGPDTKEKQNAKGRKLFRLDVRDSATADLGDGRRAIVPRHPERSELVRRITSSDTDEKMPPPETGKRLTSRDITVLQNWIQQGAEYARHWAYVRPVRTARPRVREKSWGRNELDYFILARLEAEGWKHAPEADREALIRRAALDLTGLPPSLAEVDQFLMDRAPGAYERVVDRLLAKPTFGEHWARWWLDQARYADSSGYADDPARTIWAYRDYVIRAFNANRPFDRFTVEQLAGDLLEDPTDEELVATAFHRNTMTNNEGGTNDEEYRNVAIVDRVNTTMAVWMGTTMACAQCHNHKYDPITQDEYFRLFAILNNTADADRSDETPVLSLYTDDQKRRRRELESGIRQLEKFVRTSTPELEKARASWEEKNFRSDLKWEPVEPLEVTSKAGAMVHRESDGSIRVGRGTNKTDVYKIELPGVAGQKLTALRLDVLPDETLNPPVAGHGDEGNFVISRVLAAVVPEGNPSPKGRFVRIELPGREKYLSLAEVQVFSGTNNVALGGAARQSSTAFNGPARLAIDGNTDGRYDQAHSTTHTESSTDPWWEVDLKSFQAVDRIVVWNRTDSSLDRLKGFRVSLLDDQREVVWRQGGPSAVAPTPSAEFRPSTARSIALAAAGADFSQNDFNAADVVDNKDPANRGWAVAPQTNKAHHLMVTFRSPLMIGPGSNLVVSIEQMSKFDYATLARFRLATSSDARAPEFVRVPASTLAILRKSDDGDASGSRKNRTSSEDEEVRSFYLTIAPALQKERDDLAELRKKLGEEKPYTTTPILRELPGDKRRQTKLQRRGNFLDVGAVVTEGLPASVFASAPPGSGSTDRLTLARWLVDTNNPLTARVTVNRLWESIFGIGLVRTSEEFGAQGERPSHPELLDWLAVEFMDSGWDLKHMLRLMVTSAAYRQSSRVTSELAAKDPDNRLLARGPRFRLTAEMVRDQALFVAGLLSSKMYGPPVKPPQPKLGLSAAFGSKTDWDTSEGEDRYRRALYTTWRRSNPYPSMATFDAPNREVCLVRRERSNTPLQALVTLNDPVYLEAAQALARRMAVSGKTPADCATFGFRLCLSRSPDKKELAGLTELYEKMRARFEDEPERARDVATKPLGEAPADSDLGELAAWTMVANVLLNLDEVLMKR